MKEEEEGENHKGERRGEEVGLKNDNNFFLSSSFEAFSS
jgi:hypothetical protein